MTRKFTWICPRCKEPQMGKRQDICPACDMETGGMWKVGAKHAFTTQANRLKSDTGLGR